MVRDFVAIFLAHRLYLADDLAHEALFEERFAERRLQGNRHAVVALAVIAFRLRHRDLDIFRQQRDITVRQCDDEFARRVKLFLGLVAVDCLQGLLDGAHLLANLWSEDTELRLEAVREVCLHIILEDDFLDVELLFDDFLVEVRQHDRCLDKHLADWLAVLDVGLIARSAAEHDDLEDLAHVLLEFLVNMCLIGLREVAEMDGFRCLLVDATDEVAVDGLRHERNHRCSGLGRRDECRVERHVGIDLVLFHALCPEAAAAAADVPVRELVDELLECLGGFRHAVVREVVVDILDHRVEAREAPLVHDRQLIVVERVLRRIEVVDVGVEHEERVRVPERAHELALAFLDGIVVEAVRQPRCAVLVEIPADGVSAVLLQCLHRIDGIALRLRHLAAFLVLDVAEDDDIAVRCLVEEQRRDGDERVEPAARLVDSLRDEVRREALLEDLLVVERIMPLCKRHGPRVKPAVDDFLDAVHLLAALRALDRDLVDVRTVQLDVIRAVRAHGLELLDRADDMLMAAFALPYRQRRAPVAVAREAPVLYVFEPVAEAALADGLRNPVDRLVVGDKLVLDGRHLDEPGRERVVEERRVAAPAVRIAVRELRCLEQQSLLLEVCEDQRVSLLDEEARPIRLGRELALAVDEIDKSDAVLLADAVIVFAICRSHVDNARAVFRRDVVIAGHDECLLAALVLDLLDSVRIERLILTVLEILALIALEDLALAFDTLEDLVDECLSEDVLLIADLYLDVVDRGVHAERHVRRQRPRRRRPGEERVVAVLGLELDHSRALRDILVALCHLVRGERCAAARAIRDNLVALVEQALLPDFLECPPLRLDEVVLIGDVRVLHVSPEADNIGELLPHALVLPDGLAALLDERLDAICLDLFLAVDADLLLDFELDRQAVRIPASLPEDLLALHRGEARQHVLDDARQDVADMRLAVGRRRAIVEREGIAALALVDCLLSDVMCFPELADLLLALHEIQVRIYFLIQTECLLTYEKPAPK